MTRRLARLLTITAAAVTLALATSLSAITPPKIAFTDTKLSNGLRLIVAEDHVAPVFSIVVVYNVGSRNERTGRTGFAHLFEHMMFRGSENVGVGEHFYTIFSNGGTMNGTTDKERTLYFETMPSNQLEAGMFLEADRIDRKSTPLNSSHTVISYAVFCLKKKKNKQTNNIISKKKKKKKKKQKHKKTN